LKLRKAVSFAAYGFTVWFDRDYCWLTKSALLTDSLVALTIQD
jgi:hypothetical protein